MIKEIRAAKIVTQFIKTGDSKKKINQISF